MKRSLYVSTQLRWGPEIRKFPGIGLPSHTCDATESLFLIPEDIVRFMGAPSRLVVEDMRDMSYNSRFEPRKVFEKACVEREGEARGMRYRGHRVA